MFKLPISIHNDYCIYKYVYNKRVELAKFNNIVLNTLYDYLLGGNGSYINIYSAVFGTGTAEPAQSDTTLTKELWKSQYGKGNQADSIRIVKTDLLGHVEKNKLNYKFTLKVPATTNYVGDVTEMGLVSSENKLITKALIKDAEGNPISIHKTDIEVLYVDVHMQISLAESSIFEWNEYFNYAQTIDHDYIGTTSYSSIYLPSFSSAQMCLLLGDPYKVNAYPVDNGKVRGECTYNKDKKSISFSNTRFGTTVQPTQQYINAIGMNIIKGSWKYNTYSYIPFGWILFPNEKIFAQTTLSNMPVGTGDGNETEFKPPLNLWVKDTEKIYINGVLQTRDVDYTCDHRNNLDNLISVFITSKARILNELLHCDSNDDISFRRTNYVCSNPFINGYNLIDSNDNLYTYILWDEAHPLCWELSDDVTLGQEADYFYFGEFRATDITTWVHSTYYYVTGIKLTLSYSIDNEEWHDVYTSDAMPSQQSYTIGKVIFDKTIQAKYWKISADLSEASNKEKITELKITGCYLGRNGKPIKFTNPPAVDAIITMDADIDRPMKNENFIIDCNPTIQLS